MNSQSWMMASVPAKTPTPIERAGLTEVPVAAIEHEVDHRQRQADGERGQRGVLVALVGDRQDHQTKIIVITTRAAAPPTA